jgi:hypothetical protein
VTFQNHQRDRKLIGLEHTVHAYQKRKRKKKKEREKKGNRYQDYAQLFVLNVAQHSQ